MQVRSGSASSGNAAKVLKHFVGERIVAGKLAKIGNKQNDPDINARDYQ